MKPKEIQKVVRELAKLHVTIDGIPSFTFQGIVEGMWGVYVNQNPEHEQLRTIHAELLAMNNELRQWYVKQDPERVKSIRGIEKGIGHIRCKYEPVYAERR